MSRKLVPLLAWAVAAIGFAAPAVAQVTNIAGTGCRGATFGTASGPACIGKLFGYRIDACSDTAMSFLVVGVPAATPVALQPPITCTGVCMLGCRPTLVLPEPGLNLVLPNDPSMVGGCVCAQGGCFDLARSCLTLHGAVSICFERCP